jgi:hypothetical protein
MIKMEKLVYVLSRLIREKFILDLEVAKPADAKAAQKKI